MKPWLLLQTALIKLVALWLVFGQGIVLWGWCLFFSAGCIVVVHLFQPRWQGLINVRSQLDTSSKEVWLTIDDGPCPEDTPRILDLLDTHQAKATFFMIGSRAAAYPECVAAVLARGHEVANHTMTHPLAMFWAAGLKQTREEVGGGLETLEGLGGAVRWYRSPAGIKNFWLRRVLRESRLECVAWSIRSGDALSHSPEKVVGRVLSQLRPGAIILMHEGPKLDSAVRVDAIAGVLDGLSQRGYRCVLPK